MLKKSFHLTPQTADIWNRLWVTKGTKSESAAFAQFLFQLDEGLRERLDPPALELYKAGLLTRAELIKSFDRRRARKNGEATPALAS